MNPIINPWVFYWISVLSNIQTILVIVLIITVVATIILGIMTITDAEIYSFRDKDAIRHGKLAIKMAIVSVVIGIICAIIPSESTCYKMLAAKMFTQDNINSATEYVTDVIDYAADKIKELNPTQNTEE